MTRIYARMVNREVEGACRGFRTGPDGADDEIADGLNEFLATASPDQLQLAKRMLKVATGSESE